MYSLKNDQWKFGQTYSFASLFKTDLTNFSPIFFTITCDYTPQRFSAFFFLRNYVYMYIKYMCMCSHTLPPPLPIHTQLPAGRHASPPPAYPPTSSSLLALVVGRVGARLTKSSDKNWGARPRATIPKHARLDAPAGWLPQCIQELRISPIKKGGITQVRVIPPPA